ncbi:unnamed protein product [Ceutorhynchus assimilis]|uniref:YqaJ viral recombinase domain-containing protein n=1 Tax=Ceutorhynchus assimilis TaxID=467358 RepID=A0A9N9MRK4_9CUCU|nr:unnamed protein product [Ceutorhynchus assimilis]
MFSVDRGFIKADSGNLPEVDMFMVFDYFNKHKDFISAEMRGIKLLRSGRQSYGDNAIGYVQLKQQAALCELKAKITPEHKIKSKNYTVLCVINTEEKEVVNTKCQDCAASEGGSTYDDSVLLEYISEAKKQKVENSLMRYHSTDKYSNLSIHNLAIAFKNSAPQGKNSKLFIEFCKTKMKAELILEVERDTRKHSDSIIWQEMRYGRITASKAHSVTRCKTVDGCLVESILGAKLIQTKAMKRGLYLENDILKLLEKQTGQRFFKAGIFLSQQNPLIGASPDAINKEFVVEIKSPTTEKSCLNYIDSDGNIKEKCLYQIQIQMYLSKKMHGIFVMSHPDFEKSKKITIKYCDFDEELVKSVIKQLDEFWLDNIFNKIM